MKKTYAIHAKNFVLPDRFQEGGYVVVNDGVFGEWYPEAPEGYDIIDYKDHVVAPGFVDTHIHGFAGHDVMDKDPKGLNEARYQLALCGTTSWLPTTLTSSVEEIERACESVVQSERLQDLDPVACHTQGIFLEGPFFAEKHKGAQNPDYMINPNIATFDKWQNAANGMIRKTALAPEKEGSVSYTETLTHQDIVVALGHSDATYAQAMECVEAGANVFVHTYNGMSGLHHREPGMVGAAMSTDDTYAEIICDGIHVHPAAVKALVKAKGWDKTVLVSDCLRCGGMPEGEYILGEFPIIMQDGICRLKEGGSIAGSVITMQMAAQNVFKWGIVSFDQALRMGSEVPAIAHGLNDVCGFIKPGLPADFVVVDDDLNLVETFVSGVLAR